MKSFLAFAFLLITTASFAQSTYWQQHLNYTIEAELNDAEKSITGNETIRYKNNSPDTLRFIWFHLWANAYKNDSTALFKQLHGDTTRHEEKSTGYGSIEGLAFKVNNQPAKTEAHPNANYIDVIKVLLNDPLLPGDSINISTPFKVFLPPYFSRSGYAEGEFMACQWYPKPAVYDASGWHAFPYLDMGEFYSEYGDFNVSITVPSAYVVGATGTLLNKDELESYKSIGTKNSAKRNKPVSYKPGKQPKKTLRYRATNVPDFAWFADKKFIIQYDTVKLRSGKVIDAFSYYHHTKNTQWNNSIDYVKDAVRKYSQWIGDYEYPVVQAVEGPPNASSGGMEYPMITLITSPDATVESLDAVITHEVGHNWFMSMLGSNERNHTWMDEGLNTYYQFRYEAEKYRSNSIFGNNIPQQIKQLPADQFLRTVYTVIGQNIPMESAMDIPADQYANSMEYSIVSYIKTALWMYLFEKAVGREKTDLAVQHYFKKWKHKHPQPADMQAAFEEALGEKLDDFFQLTKKEGKLE
jgi:Peptidase family M1 domain